MGNLKLINSEEFATDIEQGGELAIVDFYADWCGPCKAIAPLLEELAIEYAGKLNFYRLDVDKDGDIAAKYGVRGIPTLIIYGQGKVKDTLVGAVSKEQLTQFIENSL